MTLLVGTLRYTNKGHLIKNLLQDTVYQTLEFRKINKWFNWGSFRLRKREVSRQYI